MMYFIGLAGGAALAALNSQSCEYWPTRLTPLLLLALGVCLGFARVKVGVIVTVVIVVILVRFFLLTVALVLQGLAGEEEDGPGHDALPDVVPDLEVRSEQGLGGWLELEQDLVPQWRN